jgi:hypothetical protein
MTFLKLLFLAVLTETLVELVFKAAPLQPIRRRLITLTPWARSQEQGHLLECKYCLSVWIALFVVLIAEFCNAYSLTFLAIALIVHRISNFVHLTLSTLRDIQLDMRLKR